MAIVRKKGSAPARARQVKPVTANTSITGSVSKGRVAVKASRYLSKLTPEQKKFNAQLERNIRRMSSITAATNTSNIMARPDFLELLPLFTQKLLVTDVFGSIAMRSRQQLIPYFKFVAENTKGETAAGTVLSSPFANRQGMDPNFASRVVKNETIAINGQEGALYYGPILPGSVTINAGTSTLYDNRMGKLTDAKTGNDAGTINYATGSITFNTAPSSSDVVKATYQYDNETVGPDTQGEYGAKMGKGYLAMDEINLKAQAQELACYWSVYSAFAAQTEYGANIGDMAKEAAVGEMTAEINTRAFNLLAETAKRNTVFDWDASPVLSGAVVPHDYLNMFKLKLGQAAASIYQTTRLTRPNRLVVGSNCAEYLAMIDGYQAETATDTVGPYKHGRLDAFEVYLAPDYDPDTWVMSCKSDDIRRNSALFGEYMPITDTQVLGMANLSNQQGYATMNAMEIVNPDTVVSGRILGTF